MSPFVRRTTGLLLFLAGLALAGPALAVDCNYLLTEQPHPFFTSEPPGLGFITPSENLEQYIRNAANGESESKYGSEVLKSSLRRRRPHESQAIIEKIEKHQKLTSLEIRAIHEAVALDLREGMHPSIGKAPIASVNEYFQEYARSRIETPINDIDRAWKALGFRNIRQGDVSIVKAPTFAQLSENLASFQKKRGVPDHLQIKISKVYVDKTSGVRHFHEPHLAIKDGSDIPIFESAATIANYIEALEKNFVIAERGTHDVGHVVGWMVFPEEFDQVRKLGAMHLANPNDWYLRERFRWAAELMYFGNPKRVRLAKKTFASQSAWKNPQTTFEEQFKQVKASIDRIPLDQLRTYIDEHLLPNYASYFTPFGGGVVQYGEFEVGLGAKTYARGAAEKYYVNRVAFGDGRPGENLLSQMREEEMRGFEFQLKEIMTNPIFNEGREGMIRDIVARMEFAAVELAELNPKETLRSLQASSEERSHSQIAKLFRVLYGKDSAFYQIVTR